MPSYSLEWVLPYVRESLSKREPHKEFEFYEYAEDLWSAFDRTKLEGIVRKPIGSGYDGTSFLIRQSPETMRHVAIEAFNYLLSLMCGPLSAKLGSLFSCSSPLWL